MFMGNSWDVTWAPNQATVIMNGESLIYELVTQPFCSLCGRKYWKRFCWDSVRHENLKLATGVFHMGFYHADHSKKNYEDKLSDHIIELKSHSDFAGPIGTCMALSIVNNYKILLEGQLLVPVPSYGTDKNHAFSLCEIISEHLKNSMDITIPVQIALEKTSHKKMHFLNQIDRKEEVKDMFTQKSSISVQDKDVILVDDMLTTGDSKGECIRILKKNGARKIWIYVAAGNV